MCQFFHKKSGSQGDNQVSILGCPHLFVGCRGRKDACILLPCNSSLTHQNHAENNLLRPSHTGRLGLGSEDDHQTPQLVKTRGRHAIKAVHAGGDSTFLVNTNGRLQACGSNDQNKLGFNTTAQGLRKRTEQVRRYGE